VIRLLAVVLVWLVFVALTSAWGFLLIMYGSPPWPRQALVHAGYYAVQTVTTVGYGNWVPDDFIASREQFPNTVDGLTQFQLYQRELNAKIYAVKAMSIATALAGAVLFTFSVGFIVAVLVDIYRQD